MNRGIANAGILVRYQLEKEAGPVGDIAGGVGGLVHATGKGISGASKAWGEGADAFGRSVTEQARRAGVGGARMKGRAASGALKALPVLGLGYLGYKAFEPEVRSAKHRLGRALRGRWQLFKARRRASMPYYHEGRFQ